MRTLVVLSSASSPSHRAPCSASSSTPTRRLPRRRPAYPRRSRNSRRAPGGRRERRLRGASRSDPERRLRVHVRRTGRGRPDRVLAAARARHRRAAARVARRDPEDAVCALARLLRLAVGIHGRELGDLSEHEVELLAPLGPPSSFFPRAAAISAGGRASSPTAPGRSSSPATRPSRSRRSEPSADDGYRERLTRDPLASVEQVGVGLGDRQLDAVRELEPGFLAHRVDRG